MTIANYQIKPDGTVSFDLSLPAEAVKTAYHHVLEETAAKIELKGFRKGKAPLHLVEAAVDKSQLYSHVLDHLIPDEYAQVVKKQGFTPLLPPRLTPKSMEEGKAWEFSLETATFPEVDLGDYKKYLKTAVAKAKDQKEKLNGAFDALLKNAKLTLAPILVEEETKAALGKLVNQLSKLNLSIEDYVKSIKKTETELVNEYKATAETNLKLEFILHKLDPDRKKALDFISGL